ncbi:MAG: tRNA (adenosine(37)-N6)-threonylcarbamoyltransferase complex dimerization subunit type 1 TsaB [Acidobacteria bacterium]|nr:tRNA (adenosine(37)-N6)-threonylcarbamoyltransferase complex dimerization subunit type 1 TsaB [Acidobacteriota bacterium]
MSNLETLHTTSPLVLAVDTSSASAGFALARGETLLAKIKSDSSVPHSRAFFLQTTELFNSAGVSLNDVQLFAAATGPGSFTGLRVGLAALKGLAHALGKPLLGINSFDAVALSAKLVGEVAVLIEAGRHELYLGLRRVTDNGWVESTGEDFVGPAETLLKAIPVGQIVTGAVADSILALRPDLHFQPAQSMLAEEIASYAPKLLAMSATASLRPHYVRASDAEIKRKA